MTRTELAKVLKDQNEHFEKEMARERAEFLRRMDQQDLDRKGRQDELRESLNGIYDRLGGVEKEVSGVSGELRGMRLLPAQKRT